jgi:hypothetical protein
MIGATLWQVLPHHCPGWAAKAPRLARYMRGTARRTKQWLFTPLSTVPMSPRAVLRRTLRDRALLHRMGAATPMT